MEQTPHLHLRGTSVSSMLWNVSGASVSTPMIRPQFFADTVKMGTLCLSSKCLWIEVIKRKKRKIINGLNNDMPRDEVEEEEEGE